MRKFSGQIAIRNSSFAYDFEFEVEDGATEEEIEEIAQEVAFNLIDWGYEEVK